MEDDATELDPGSGLRPEEPEPPLEESAEAKSEPEFEPPTPAQLEKAENLIRQSNLAKIRGDKVAAEKLLDEAAAAAPGSSAVQEALGDAYIDRKQVRKARDCFKLAFKIDPKNASAERKYGECVLSIQLALDPSFASPPPDDSFASGKGALILSFLVPGLGQIAMSETKKGLTMLGMWLGGGVLSFLIPNGLSSIPTLFGARGPSLNGLVFVPLFATIVAWMWSISDAGAKAKRYEPKTVVRPVPPVDKEF